MTHYETDVPLPEIAAILGIICYIKDGTPHAVILQTTFPKDSPKKLASCATARIAITDMKSTESPPIGALMFMPALIVLDSLA